MTARIGDVCGGKRLGDNESNATASLSSAKPHCHQWHLGTAPTLGQPPTHPSNLSPTSTCGSQAGYSSPTSTRQAKALDYCFQHHSPFLRIESGFVYGLELFQGYEFLCKLSDTNLPSHLSQVRARMVISTLKMMKLRHREAVGHPTALLALPTARPEVLQHTDDSRANGAALSTRSVAKEV